MTVDLSNVIEYHTVKEIAEMLNTTQKDVLEELKKQGLEVKYCRRTKYSNSLIPVNEKRFTGKKRNEINKAILSDMGRRGWPECEIKHREKDLKEYNFTIGMMMYNINKLQSELHVILQKQARQQMIVNALKDIKETKDYCAFIEEDQYGKVEVEKFTPEMLNEDIIAGYLSQVLNTDGLLIFNQLLNKYRKGE